MQQKFKQQTQLKNKPEIKITITMKIFKQHDFFVVSHEKRNCRWLSIMLSEALNTCSAGYQSEPSVTDEKIHRYTTYI